MDCSFGHSFTQSLALAVGEDVINFRQEAEGLGIAYKTLIYHRKGLSDRLPDPNKSRLRFSREHASYQTKALNYHSLTTIDGATNLQQSSAF